MNFFKILFVLPLFLSFSSLQEKKLSGSYKIIFEAEYNSQDGIIVFKDSFYERNCKSKTIKGNVDYQKFRVILKDEKTSLQMIISKREIGRDTISFSTINLDKKMESDDIIIHEGKLIKIKDNNW